MNFKRIIKSDLFIFLFFLLIFYGLFRYTESLNKGFDVVEDQHIIKADESLNSRSFMTALDDLLKFDMDGYKRFRPFWVVFFLIMVKLFGVNLLIINLFVAVICILTAYFLYKFCERSGFTRFQSVLFSLLTLIGPATIMYARPMDAEIIGMLMFSLSLYFLSKSIYSEIRSVFYKSLFIITLVITSLCKENFLITTPALLIIYLLFYSEKNKTGIWQSIRKNYLIIILIAIFSLTILYLVIQTVGVNKNHGYAGVKGNLFSIDTIISFGKLIFTINLSYILLLGIFILLETSIVNKRLTRINIKANGPKIIFISVFFVLLVLPQFIFYSKTGFEGRYYLPFLFGFSFAIIFISKEIFSDNLISKFIKYLYILTIIIFLVIELRTSTLPAFKSYVYECKTVTELLKTIKNSPGDDLLIVMDPVQNYPQMFTFKIYLDYLKSQKDYRYDLIKRDYLHPHYNDTSFYNKFLNFAKINLYPKQIDSSKENREINNILVLNTLNEKFLRKNVRWFDPNIYRKKQIGGYTMYQK